MLVSVPSSHSLITLVRKLQSIAPLSPDEQQAVLDLPVTIRVVRARHDIVREGDRPSQCCFLLTGWACRYKLLDEGRRQITAFHVAGDALDLQSLYLSVMDHGVASLTTATLAFIPHDAVCAVVDRFPGLARAFRCDALIDAAIFQEWVANIGRRSAFQRLSHLLCEMYTKQEAVGLAQDHRCDLPVTQVDLADATGLTDVHVNRTLKEMKNKDLITTMGRGVSINNWQGLTTAAGFDPTYLHIRAQATA